LSDQDQLKIQFDTEENINVTNKKISEQTDLEVRDIILQFRQETSPRMNGIKTEIVKKMEPALWRKIHNLIKTV
jgi:hypothetical protein